MDGKSRALAEVVDILSKKYRVNVLYRNQDLQKHPPVELIVSNMPVKDYLKKIIDPKLLKIQWNGKTLLLQEVLPGEYVENEKMVSTIEIPDSQDKPWRFRAFRESDQEGIWYWDEKAYYESLFIDPYTAKVIAHENSEFDFLRIVLYLHWSLLFKTSIGQPIVGVATLMYVLSLISGLFLWWPSNKKGLRKRLSFQWKTSTGFKRKIYDLHNILGFYILSIGLLLGLTGLVWAFPAFGNTLQKILDGNSDGKQEERYLNRPESGAIQPYNDLLKYMEINYPTASGYLFYRTSLTERSTITAVVKSDKAFENVVLIADGHTGEIIKAIGYGDKTAGQKFREINYELHVGSALGLTGKILVFIASLVSASLPLTGFLIWINRRRKNRC